jgi:Spy/CpxP family protein refolding chaperone
MRTMRAAVAAAFLLAACTVVLAQKHPPGPPAGGSSSLQLGPAGRWWDNKSYAKSIGLKHEQQQRMDAVFNANKATLFNTYRTLKAEEQKLDALQRAESPDEDAIRKQIDTVNALRGQLQKQSATLALALRKELTPEQVQQLESAK